MWMWKSHIDQLRDISNTKLVDREIRCENEINSHQEIVADKILSVCANPKHIPTDMTPAVCHTVHERDQGEPQNPDKVTSNVESPVALRRSACIKRPVVKLNL